MDILLESREIYHWLAQFDQIFTFLGTVFLASYFFLFGNANLTWNIIYGAMVVFNILILVWRDKVALQIFALDSTLLSDRKRNNLDYIGFTLLEIFIIICQLNMDFSYPGNVFIFIGIFFMIISIIQSRNTFRYLQLYHFRKPIGNDDETTCSICLTAPVQWVFMHGDCGHLISCDTCLPKIDHAKCPLCQESVRKIIPY